MTRARIARPAPGARRARRPGRHGAGPAAHRGSPSQIAHLLMHGDSTTRIAVLLSLQQTHGNAFVQRLAEEAAPAVALPPLAGRGRASETDAAGGCDGLSLHGNTHADFDGGHWRVAGERLRLSKDCTDCPPDTRCLHLTGTLVTNYRAAVVIEMPPVPDGLSACERRLVRRFLDRVLAPHEREHRRRLKTYDGQTRHPVDITGCGRDDLTQQLADMQAAEAADREAAANALSHDLDPFRRTADCSACEEAG